MNEHTDNYTLPRPPEIHDNKPHAEAAFTPADIMTRIDKIIGDTEHIQKALDTLTGLQIQGGYDNGAEHKARAISQVVLSRENTNQQMIAFLQRMYEDIIPQREPNDVFKFRAIMESLKGFENFDEDMMAEIISTVVQQMFVSTPVSRPKFHNYNNNNCNARPGPQHNPNFNSKPHTPKGPNAAYAAFTAHDGNPFDVAGFLRNIADQMSGFGGSNAENPKDGDADEGEEE